MVTTIIRGEISVPIPSQTVQEGDFNDKRREITHKTPLLNSDTSIGEGVV